MLARTSHFGLPARLAESHVHVRVGGSADYRHSSICQADISGLFRETSGVFSFYVFFLDCFLLLHSDLKRNSSHFKECSHIDTSLQVYFCGMCDYSGSK